jgi:hypothetical protein
MKIHKDGSDMQINYVIAALVAAGVIIAGTYFLSKKSGPPSRIKKKTLDKLSLFYVKEFFQQNIQPLADGCTPIALRIPAEQAKKMRVPINEEPGMSYYVLSYYDPKTGQVMDGCLLIEAKSVDSLLEEAFGDKDMLILE